MLEINLSKQNFEDEVLKNEGLVLVDFYGTWCGPCKMLAPIVSEIANDYKDKVKVGKVNVDEQSELAIEYEITNIPTLILFKDGKVVKSLIGLHSKSEIEDMINI